MRTFRGEILSVISGAFCSEEIPPEYFPESNEVKGPEWDGTIEHIQEYVVDCFSECDPVDLLETIVDRADTVLEVIMDTEVTNFIRNGNGIKHDAKTIDEAFGIRNWDDFDESLKHRMMRLTLEPLNPSGIVERCISGFTVSQAIASMFIILTSLRAEVSK
ncbi:TPA: hypothetical protein DCG86_09165 [Candidatus Marinimicrobia bacterium]|nr:hypothetical protein [Candidatus Neomarinimicrobiota bacterium]